MHFSAQHYASVVLAMALCLCVHLSQASIVSKRLDKSSWVLAWRLPFTYPTLCFREIWASPKIRVLPSGTLSKLWTGKFRHAKLIRSTKHVDCRACGPHLQWSTPCMAVYCTSVNCNPQLHYFDLLYSLFLQWQGFYWHSALHGTPAVTELLVISWLHPGITTQ